MVEPLMRYDDFSIFQDGGRHHLGFSKDGNFGVEGSRESKCVTVPNFAAIVQTVAEICRFFDFSRWQPPPSWIFKKWEF